MSYPPPSIDTPPTKETYEAIREWLNEDPTPDRAAYWARWQDTLRSLRNELYPDRLAIIKARARALRS